MTVSTRFIAGGLLTGLFVSGAVTGGVVMHAVGDGADDGSAVVERPDDRGGRGGGREGSRARRGGRPSGPRGIADARVVESLITRLELSEEQGAAVRAILTEQRVAAEEVFADIGPRLTALLESTNEHIRATLTPEQQVLFDEMLQEDRGILGRRYGPSGRRGSGG